jgi:hypothetical protein
MTDTTTLRLLELNDSLISIHTDCLTFKLEHATNPANSSNNYFIPIASITAAIIVGILGLRAQKFIMKAQEEKDRINDLINSTSDLIALIDQATLNELTNLHSQKPLNSEHIKLETKIILRTHNKDRALIRSVLYAYKTKSTNFDKDQWSNQILNTINSSITK